MKLHKRIFATAAATVIACSLFVGCGGSGSSTSASSGASAPSASTAQTVSAGDKTLKMYIAGFQNLDPHIWSWGTHVDRMGIFEGLTLLNSDFTTRLGNAERLEHNED